MDVCNLLSPFPIKILDAMMLWYYCGQPIVSSMHIFFV